MNEEHAEGRSFASVAFLVLSLIAAVIAVAAAREWVVGSEEIAAADSAASRADWKETIVHARAAAQAFVPASPWPELGKDRLESVGHEAESRGDQVIALLAYGALRTAALTVAAPGWGHPQWLDAADAGIARVATWETKRLGARESTRGGLSSTELGAFESTLRVLRRGRDEGRPAKTSFFLALAVMGFAVGTLRLLFPAGRGPSRRTAQALVVGSLAAYAAGLLFVTPV